MTRKHPSIRSLYVVGGQQRQARSLGEVSRDWHGYNRGRVVQVNVASGTGEARVTYASPPEACADVEPEILFQSGALQDGLLYTCTGTEALVYSVPDFHQVGYVSLPCFNDVHAVIPGPEGDLLVASAGLEMVVQVSLSGHVRNVWNVLGEDPWERFSKTIDYRKIASTKPHRAHPNFLFSLDNQTWATRFQQGDAVRVDDPAYCFEVSDERIHDGLVHEGRIYFTTVSGKVVIVDATSLGVLEVINLTSMHPDSELLGWCRGILIDGDFMWVGFSRIRPTKVRENVAWIARGFKRVHGTHIACYNLVERRCVTDIDLEPLGLNAVFGIFPASTS